MGRNWTSFITVLFLILLIKETSCQKDEEENKGKPVVDTALEKLKEYSDSGLKFLRNIACAESKYGNAKDTYRQDYHGGIWQVDKERFEETQDTALHPELSENYEKLKELYGINWGTVKWKELRDPFHSLLAARLVLQIQDEDLPSEEDLNAQGEYWSKYFISPENEDTASNFVQRVRACRRENKGNGKEEVTGPGDETTDTNGGVVPQGGEGETTTAGVTGEGVVDTGDETENATKEEIETKTLSGEEVVDTSIEKLMQYSDKGLIFLKNIACAESKYGTDEDTYRENYHGGIWQVDEATFNDTKDTASHPKLKERHEKIRKIYDIEWKNVQWQELQDPFYSVLAARIFLQNQAEKLPSEKDVNKQGEYWRIHYNPDDETKTATASDFVHSVEECSKKEEEEEKPGEIPEDEDRKIESPIGKPVQWIGCPTGPKVPEWERLVADPSSCDHFYHCNSNGLTWKKACPSVIKGSKFRLHWNDELKVCDWPSRANCKKTKR